MLIEETLVPSALLPIAEFKAHLLLGSGFAEDSAQDVVLESFLRAALAAVEAKTGKAVLRRDFTWTVSAWRSSAEQPLPIAPVQAVTAVILRERQGVETALPLVQFHLQQDAHVPCLKPVSMCFPDVGETAQVQIAFSAGLAESWDRVPADLAQAVLMLAAHFYEYRHETGLGRGCMPFGVTSLLERYRAVRIGIGGGL